MDHVFVQILPDGSPVELAQDQAFTTYSIVPLDGLEAVGLMTPIGEIAEHVVNHPAGALAIYDQEDLDRYCIHKIEMPERPSGLWDEVLGKTLSIEGGKPVVEWKTKIAKVDDVRARALREVQDHFDMRRTSEMPWDFGDVVAIDDAGHSAPAGKQTLQMRETPVDDTRNWAALGSAAAAAVQAGQPDMLMPMRTTANVWVQTTAAQVVQVLVTGDGEQLSATQRATEMIRRKAELTTSINLARTRGAMEDLIDATETGWPA